MDAVMDSLSSSFGVVVNVELLNAMAVFSE